jgi:hypothetical protein
MNRGLFDSNHSPSFLTGGDSAMLDEAIRINGFLMRYLATMVAEIPDARMAEQPLPGVNHPAWILGHLAWAADRALRLVCSEKAPPEEWTTLYGTASEPSTERGKYPSKDELVRAVEESYERLREGAAVATGEQLSRPNAHARTREALPTSREVVAFLMTGHLGVHLGQLSSWRRMIGLAPMF